MSVINLVFFRRFSHAYVCSTCTEHVSLEMMMMMMMMNVVGNAPDYPVTAVDQSHCVPCPVLFMLR